MFPTKNIEDLKGLNELASLQNQVQAVRLQDKLGRQNFHEDMKKVIKPITKSLKDVSQEVTKTKTDTSNNKNKALENLNNKLLETMNDRVIVASYLMSPLSTIIVRENYTQFELLKGPNSNRVNDMLIHNTIPITLHDNLLPFRDIGKELELKGDLLKTRTYKNYNVDIASLSDKKFLYEFAKEMNFDLKAQGNKST